jgi:hypothetical protein
LAQASQSRTRQPSDPDVWVIEIEHRDGWHPFEGKVF